ncbi:cysteine desulfurase, partial [Streptomyces sp. NPDC006422]
MAAGDRHAEPFAEEVLQVLGVADAERGERRPQLLQVPLDYAASAPALQRVWDDVAAYAPYYGSVHRGA